MWKKLAIFLLFIVAFGIFFLFVYFWGGKLMGGLGSIFPKEDVDEFESVFSEEESNEISNEILNEEFISPDGKLKFNYSSDWKISEDETALKKVYPEDLTKKLNLKVLFFGQYLKAKVFSQFFVAEGYLGNQTTSESIIKIFKESGRAENWEVTILNQNFENNRFDFEFLCRKENSPSFHFKELVILSKEAKGKSYLITFVGPEEDWSKMRDRADKIFESIQIID